MRRHSWHLRSDARADSHRPMPPEGLTRPSTAEPMCFIYTSGTTGLPKAAIITNQRFMLASNLFARGIYEAREGPAGASVATTLSNLGALYLSMERFRRSIVAFERVLEIQEATLGPDSHDAGVTLERLAQAQLEVGEAEAAEVLGARFVANREQLFGSDHPSVAAALRRQAKAAAAQGAADRARELEARADRIEFPAPPSAE